MWRMGRTRRVNLPGAPFHLIARLQERRPDFLGLEQRVTDTILRISCECRVQLLAYAVMPNHLHLLAVQGREPLASFMQPLLRRLALQVQRRHGRQGHVFERRYRAHVCLGPERVRRVLCYIHLNPVRAGLCSSPAQYEWTSHHAYCRTPATRHSHDPRQDAVETGLRLFGCAADITLADCRASYRRFLAWRLEVDRLQHDRERTLQDWAAKPVAMAGDVHWADCFGAASSQLLLPARRIELEEIGRAVIAAHFPDMTLDALRAGGRQPAVVAARRLMTERAATAGYANHQIARYLRVSPSAVSRIVCAARAGRVA